MADSGAPTGAPSEAQTSENKSGCITKMAPAPAAKKPEVPVRH